MTRGGAKALGVCDVNPFIYIYNYLHIMFVYKKDYIYAASLFHYHGVTSFSLPLEKKKFSATSLH